MRENVDVPSFLEIINDHRFITRGREEGEHVPTRSTVRVVVDHDGHATFQGTLQCEL
jgi:hypothetical protein